MKLFTDLFGVLRLQVQPLPHYAYPAWQPMLLLTLLGLVDALTVNGFNSDLLTRLLFFITLNWLDALLLVFFMTQWLKKSGWRGEGSLFPLVVLTQVPQLLMLIGDGMDEQAALMLSFVVTFYSVVVLVRALSQSTGVTRQRTVLGVVLYLPIALALGFGGLGLSAQMGWVQPVEQTQQSEPAVTAPSSSEVN